MLRAAMRTFLPRALLVAASAFVALGVVEVALRLGEPTPPAAGDLEAQLSRSAGTALGEGATPNSLMGLVRASPFPDVVYELKPGLSGTFRGNPLRVNAHGLRGPEVTLEKPPGTFRIAGIGDSVMFGWGVGEGDPYLQVLERQLAERYPGRRFECLNFAVPGYNAAIEAAVLQRRALAFEPDLVVVHFVHNDLGLPHFMQPAPPPAPRSRLLALLRERLGGGEPAEAPPPLLGHAAQLRDLRDEARGQYQHMVGEDGYRRAMARLARAAATRGVPVILLTLERGREAAEPARTAAREHGFRYLDATPRFTRYLADHGLGPRDWAGTLTIRGDGHPTPLGHALFAEVLLPEVEGFLDAGGP